MATVEIKGEDALKIALNRLAFDLNKAIDLAVRVTAFKVQITAMDNIREPSRSGNFVSRGVKARHEISKEGDSPNTDSGRLIGSIAVEHVRGSQEAFVGTNLDYGLFLETTLNRPWLEPAKDAEIKFFSDNMSNALNAQIKKAGQ